MHFKFTDKNLQTQHAGNVQQYVIGEWVKPADGKMAQYGEPCGEGSLHLMKHMRPIYAPYPYLAHEAKGKGKMGEDSEKARYKEVKLIRTLTDDEINRAMDDDWASQLGRHGLFLPIAWARTATFLDRPVNQEKCRRLLKPLCCLLGKPSIIEFIDMRDSLRASLGDSLRDSLRDSLWVSLWASLYFERGFELAGNPKQELQDLPEVWKMGACPLGWSKGKLQVLVLK